MTLVVGVLVVASLVTAASAVVVAQPVAPATTTSTADRPSTPVDIEAFLAAWKRSRTATFRLEARFVRRRTGQAPYRVDEVIVQRPPERVVVNGGDVSVMVGGAQVACSTPDGAAPACRAAVDPATYESQLADDLRALRGYLTGSHVLYQVVRRGACFDVRLHLEIPAPPLGRRATFCFDQATGAPRSTRIERDGATDEITTRSITPRVTDDDLEAARSGTPTTGR